ncbi:MAG TPA: cell division protein ZapA [Vicinamibacterales bacterium]|nr:cell division protein ZapA [Vicinamibacterales bacterium]
MSNSRVMHVDIYGQRYAIRSALDPQYIGELAALLDEKMRLAARELSSNDPLRVAIVASLNLADELQRAQADASGAQGVLLERAAEIERLVDAVLDGARVKAVNE